MWDRVAVGKTVPLGWVPRMDMSSVILHSLIGPRLVLLPCYFYGRPERARAEFLRARGKIHSWVKEGSRGRLNFARALHLIGRFAIVPCNARILDQSAGCIALIAFRPI